ncbi:MAG: hypothetical protein ACLRI8_00360 [Agathobacter rectalis]
MFYVGMTRARQLVCLLGQVGKR